MAESFRANSPEITGVDNDGETFTLDEYKGKVIVLDFFANWCPHCKAMYPHEQEMVEDFAEKPFVLLGVHCESQKILGELIDTGTVTWRCWADGAGGPIAERWNLTGYPYVVLIDAGWNVRKVYSGNPGDQLRKDVEKLLREINEADR